MDYPIELHYHVLGLTAGIPEPVWEDDVPQRLRDVLSAPRPTSPGDPGPEGTGCGEGTTVAILDTGYTQHPYLEESVEPDSPIGQSDYDGWDISGHDMPAYVGHGTFVAGRVRQEAPAAGILYRKITDRNGVSNDWTLATAIFDLIPKTEGAPGPDVLNLSLGPGEHELPRGWPRSLAPRTRFAISALQEACGTVVVIAAGPPSERSSDSLLARHGEERTVFVGAVNPSGDAPAEFSAHDCFVDLFASGQDVLSTFVYWNGAIRFDECCPACDSSLHMSRHRPNNRDSEPPLMAGTGWARWSGTSFAAPAVAGAIAREISGLEGEQCTTIQDRRLKALNNLKNQSILYPHPTAPTHNRPLHTL